MTQVELAAPLGGVHGFPVALTSFVGRAGEVEEVAGLLAQYRLVTVTGPGGVGKTRLAAQVIRQVADRFADGVWLVELAMVRDPALVQVAVATALGVRQAPGMSVPDSLAAVLAPRQLLMVLDNCEHVLAVVAELCGALLPAADDMRILATSREPVGVSGESRYRLAPLPLPGDPAGLGSSEAITLFADRARQADPHFTLTPESAPAVARLVRVLDGMPLAIELAAARVEALGVAQLADRLADRFRLLAGTDRLAAARQQSLAATAEWSYDLLTEQEQQVFRRLAILPGAFTLEAAEAVAGADAGPAVLHLVDCSLLTPPRTGPDGQARYLMLETLRAYAAERLAEAGEQVEAATDLAGFALDVVGQAAAALESSAGELAGARWLEAEDATVHQALAWALENDPDTALRMAIALAPWWSLRGREPAGYALLRTAAGHATPGGPAWCAAQCWLGELVPGQEEQARLEHYTAVLDAMDVTEPSVMLVRALNGRAECLGDLGLCTESAADARRALALARELGYPAGEAIALLYLGMLAHFAGDHEESLAWLQRAHQVHPAAMPGRTARECSIYLAKALREVPGQAGSALQTCTQALAGARQAGALHQQTDCLQLMADLDLQTGRLPEARAHLREAIEIARRIPDRYRLIECVDISGHLCAQAHRWAEAMTLWAARAAHLRDTPQPDLPLENRRRQEPMRTAHQVLGAAQARAAEERGAAMTLAIAAEYALMLIPSESRDLQDPPARQGMLRLSARERELVTLVAHGRTDAQIAAQLFISVRTVRSHLDRIRDKTGFRRRADLTRLALQASLV